MEAPYANVIKPLPPLYLNLGNFSSTANEEGRKNYTIREKGEFSTTV
jgi:hypothetical protein